MTSNCKIHLVGHSLAGGIVHHCMISNEFIFNNITRAHCFNPGVGLSYIRKSLANMTFTQDQETIFKKKINVYHVSGDVISKLSNALKGSFFMYRLKESYFSHLLYLGSLVIFPSVTTYLLLNVTKTGKFHSMTNFIL